MSCNYSSFLIGCVLVIVCISLVHQMFYTPTNTLQQYIMFSVDPTTNRPMHLVLFHDDRRALYKKINHAKTKKKKKTSQNILHATIGSYVLTDGNHTPTHCTTTCLIQTPPSNNRLPFKPSIHTRRHLLFTKHMLLIPTTTAKHRTYGNPQKTRLSANHCTAN